MRLFVGIPLPDNVRKRIDDMIKEWKKEISSIKYVERENLHITLKFIGEVDERRAARIKDILHTIHTHPITVELRGIGGFPSTERPRVIWIGVKEGFGEIVALSKEIDEVLAAEGIPREFREFHPHVTIGRVKKFSPAIRMKIEKYKEISFGQFEVDRFLLYRSTLTPAGPIYERISEYGVKE